MQTFNFRVPPGTYWFRLLLLLLPLFSAAQIPDPKPNTYVNDLAGTLTPAQVQLLNDSILAIEKRSSVQIAVILVDKLDGISIEDYAIGVGRKWHVGNAANGLVYVVSIQDRKQRLEVARALQFEITDYTAMQLTDQMKPFLREKDYYGGIALLLKGISEKLNPILQQQKALAKAEMDKKNANDANGLLWFMVIGVAVIGASVWLVIYWQRRKEKAEQNEREQRENAQRTEAHSEIAIINQVNALRRKHKLPPMPVDRIPPYSPYIPPTPSPVIYDAPLPARYTRDEPSKSDDSSYGNWGSGSSSGSDSGSSSSDSSSGYDGGGASNDF